MKTRIFLLVISVIGVVSAVRVSLLGAQDITPSAPVAQPSQTPFARSVAGLGVIEASSENIAIGTQLAGVVDQVLVTPGSVVKQGDPLFILDSRQASANELVRRVELEVARATVKEVEVSLSEARDLLDRANKLAGPALSEEERRKRSFSARFAELSLQKSKAEEGVKRALHETALLTLDLHTVRSPIDGVVLQVRVRVGEYIGFGEQGEARVVVGQLEPLHVRVDVDEHDAWRVQQSRQGGARVFLRGNSALWWDAKLKYTEPLVVPKRSLSGESNERVDTRVMQIIYELKSSQSGAITGGANGEAVEPLVGQLVDVFIEDLS